MSRASEIYNPSFLLQTGKKSEILHRLGELHKALSTLSQEPCDRPKHLSAIAGQLVTDRLLGSQDKEIRLLSAATIVDILRVYAPEAPFSDSELCHIFRAITRELKGLSTCDMESIAGTRIFYILQSLSIVKSCVLLVCLSQSHVAGATDALVQFFDVLVASVRSDHSEVVIGHIGSILQACIEESEHLDSQVLCVLLSGLLPPSRVDSPAAYRLCQSVLRRVAGPVQNEISSLINKILVGASADYEDIERCDLSEHVYSLILEVHRIAPGLLLRVLPNICIQLQVEELDVRLKAVRLLSSLFSSPYADYGQEFSRNFRDYLGRFVDIAPEVRLEMVTSGPMIIKQKAALRKLVEECMSKRLRDSEWEVRQEALQRLAEVASENPLLLSMDTYIEMAERMKDKRPSIRRNAMLYMARLYSRHVSGHFSELEDLAMGEGGSPARETFGAPADSWGLLRRVPEYIISCWGYPEFVDRQLVLQILQENLLPRYSYHHGFAGGAPPRPPPAVFEDAEAASPAGEAVPAAGRAEASEGLRATALVAMWTTLEASGRKGLASILGFKTKVRLSLSDFLRVRSSASSGGHAMELRKSMLRIFSTLVPQDKKQLSSESINSFKDNHIYRLLGHALVSSARDTPRVSKPLSSSSGSAGFHAICAFRDDLKARVGSKTALGEYMACLFETSAFMVASRDTVSSLARAGSFLAERLTGYRRGQSTSKKSVAAADASLELLIVNVLSMISKYCAQSMEGADVSILSWLQSAVGVPGAGSSDPIKRKDRSSNVPTPINLLCPEVTFSLLSTIKLSAVYLWPADGGVTSELCDSLLKWGGLCTEEDASFAFTEAACALISAPSERVGDHSPRWASYVPRYIDVFSSLLPSRSPSQSASLSKEKLDQKQLCCNLNCLAALCKIGGEVIFPTEKKLVDFLISEYISGDRTDAHHAPFDLHVLRACIRCWVSCAVVVEGEGRGDGSADEELALSPSMGESTGHIVQHLFRCLERQGGAFGNRMIVSKEEKEELRETCTCALFELIKVKPIGRSYSVAQWQTLAWALVDSSKQSRRRILSVLGLIIQTHAVHPRFLALPCLLAGDEENRQIAQQALEFSIKRLRLSHEMLCSKVMTLEDEGDEMGAERTRLIAEANMPECVLPYVIHLLSYHPDFPVSLTLGEEGDAKRASEISKSLKMVVSALLGSVRTEVGNNLSYLLKQVEILSSYYSDKLNADNHELNVVATMARKILLENGRSSENLQPYPGEIHLPMDLYKRRVQMPSTATAERSPMFAPGASQKHSLGAVSEKGPGDDTSEAGQEVVELKRKGASAGRSKGSRKRIRSMGSGKENTEVKIVGHTRSSSRLIAAKSGVPQCYAEISSSDSEEEPGVPLQETVPSGGAENFEGSRQRRRIVSTKPVQQLGLSTVSSVGASERLTKRRAKN